MTDRPTAGVPRIAGSEALTGSVAEYYELLADGSHEGRARLRQYEASEEVWLEILRDDPEQVYTVMVNKKLPPRVLAALAENEDWRVRLSVVEKHRTPSWILARLVEDPDDSVRLFVASHRNTTVDSLQTLTKDPWRGVREEATRRLQELGIDVADAGPAPSWDGCEAEDDVDALWEDDVPEGNLADRILRYLDDDEVQLLPDDPDREPGLNSWAYGVGGNSSTPDEIIAAVHAVVDGLRLRWKDSPLHGRFYVWYDVMAGNLNLSVTSQDPLPFRGRIRETDNLSEVVDEVVSDPSPGHISWEELEVVEPGDETVEELDPWTPVWVTSVP